MLVSCGKGGSILQADIPPYRKSEDLPPYRITRVIIHRQVEPVYNYDAINRESRVCGPPQRRFPVAFSGINNHLGILRSNNEKYGTRLRINGIIFEIIGIHFEIIGSAVKFLEKKRIFRNRI